MVGRATSKLRPGWYIEYSDRYGCNQRLTEMTKSIVSYYTFDYFYTQDRTAEEGCGGNREATAGPTGTDEAAAAAARRSEDN